MLGLLAEYGIWPNVINASLISDSVKVLIIAHKFAVLCYIGFVLLFNYVLCILLLSTNPLTHHGSRLGGPES
jgi:hypothetical protein